MKLRYICLALACVASLAATAGLAALPLPEGSPVFLQTLSGEPFFTFVTESGEILVVQQNSRDGNEPAEAEASFYRSTGAPAGPQILLPPIPDCNCFVAGAAATEGVILLVWRHDTGEFVEFPPNSLDPEPSSSIYEISNLFGQRYDREGNPTGSAFPINDENGAANGGFSTTVDIAFRADGSFYVAWGQVGPETFVDADFYVLSRARYRWFSAEGAPLSPDVDLRQSPRSDAPFAETALPRIVQDPATDSLWVIWTSHGMDFYFTETALRRLRPDGTLLTPELLLADPGDAGTDPDFRALAGATILGDGNLGVVFEYGEDAILRRYSPGGLIVGEDVTIPLGRGTILGGFPCIDSFNPLPADLLQLADGRLLLVETACGDFDSTLSGPALGRWLSPDGLPVGEAFRIDTSVRQAAQGLKAVEGPKGEVGVVYVQGRPFPQNDWLQLRSLAEVCTPGPSTLCLEEGRFRVDVAWADFREREGFGNAYPLSSETGYFTYFDESNVELVVKVLDGGANNGNFWVFYGSLTNVEFRLTVTDTTTGTQKIYENPLRSFASVGDTAAFPGAASAPLGTESLTPAQVAALLPGLPGDGPGLATAGETGESLSFHGGRFEAGITWRDFRDRTGTGQGALLTEDTGYFWFFRPENVEVIVKVLDGRSNNGHWWVFYGALTNVEWNLTVTDTVDGTTQEYFNPLRTFGSDGDTRAFED